MNYISNSNKTIMITIILHNYKTPRITKSTVVLCFVSIVKWNLLEKLEKGISMYKELKHDYKIVNDLVNNNQRNGYKETGNKRKSY